ncbi:MAG: transglycosylase SLT domain-containing protein, partial [Candidatus Puniceispirillaceae bacterium]
MMRHNKLTGLWLQIMQESVAVFFQMPRRGIAILASLIILLLLAAPAKATLPTPLSDFDVAQYTRLFELQQQGNMKQATREMARLQDPLLKGHLLSQRYLHPTAWRSSFAELSGWLKLYNDHPNASRIFWLAKRRIPKNTRDPKSPKPGYLNGYGYAGLYGYAARIPASRAGRASPSRTANVARQVRRSIRRGWPTGAHDVLKNPDNRRYLTKAEEGQLRSEIAHAYFIFGVDAKAIREARHAIGVGKSAASLGYWAGGLAAWRSAQYDLAGQFFRSLVDLPGVSPGRRSAAAFWAHRVELRAGNAAKSIDYLTIAAQEIDSFYGAVAREALGQKVVLSFDLPLMNGRFIAWLAARPGGQRMFGLLQIGNTHSAERELRYLWMEIPDEFKLSAMRLAAEQGMAGLSFRIAEIIRKDTGKSWYGALYPHPMFQADFSIDEALVWALSRQESGFNPRAKSRAKAAGLMQLMPATAAFIAKDRGYRGRKRHELFEPAVNLWLGQTY